MLAADMSSPDSESFPAKRFESFQICNALGRNSLAGAAIVQNN
jgi:hypothetical protein